MQIDSPEIKKTLLDIDIILDFGVTIPITIDAANGDTFDIGTDQLQIHIAAKKSISDPDQTIPAEDMTIFKSHVVSIQKRTREIIELSPEQKSEQLRIFKEWATIQ